MRNEKENVRAKSNEAAKRAKQYSPAVQYAIVQALPNISNGAFWGFTTLDDVKEHIDAIKSEPNIIARKVDGSCLLEVNPSFLLTAIQAIDPNALVKEDIVNIQNAIAEAKIGFERMLISKGKQPNGFGGTIGVYCINDTSTICYKDVNYPAFRVTLADALQMMNNYGYAVQVKGQFVSPSNAMNMGQALWDSLKLSPTKTGIFINIKSTYSPEQMKQLEKQFKAKYSKK